jgi:hypothetical protein
LRAKQNTAAHCRRFAGQCRISATTEGDLATRAVIAGAYVSYTGIKRDENDFYPEKFDATHVLFNAHRVFPSECLYVTDHPLKVLRGHQDGIVNAVSIFGVYDADRLLALSSFVRRRRLGRVEFF